MSIINVVMTCTQTLVLNNGDCKICICYIFRMLWEWPKYFIQTLSSHNILEHGLLKQLWLERGSYRKTNIPSKFVFCSPFRKAFFFQLSAEGLRDVGGFPVYTLSWGLHWGRIIVNLQDALQNRKATSWLYRSKLKIISVSFPLTIFWTGWFQNVGVKGNIYLGNEIKPKCWQWPRFCSSDIHTLLNL